MRTAHKPINKLNVTRGTLLGFFAGSSIMCVIVAGFVLTDGGGPGASATSTRLVIVFGFLAALACTPQRALAFTESMRDTLTSSIIMTISATLAYVLVWEIYLYLSDYEFIERYIRQRISAKHEQNLTANQLTQSLEDLNQLRSRLLDPLSRTRLTAQEILPTGGITALMACLTLHVYGRRRNRPKHSL